MLTQQKATKSNKKNIVLLAVLAVALGVIGYLLYGQFFTSTPVQVAGPTQYSESITADFDQALFQTEKFIKLRLFGEFPIVVKSVGNTQLLKF